MQNIFKCFLHFHSKLSSVWKKVCNNKSMVGNYMFVKVTGAKVYPTQTWNFRSHAVSACISLWHHRLMHAPHRLMHACTACIAHDITGQCMQLLHGLCCFDFVSDIPLSPATLHVCENILYFTLFVYLLCCDEIYWQFFGKHGRGYSAVVARSLCMWKAPGSIPGISKFLILVLLFKRRYVC